MSERFVPLTGAHLASGGIHVEFTRARVKDAPGVEAGRDLTAAEEKRLFEHYQLDGARPGTAGAARPAGPAMEAEHGARAARAEMAEQTEQIERGRLRRHDPRSRDA